MSPPNRPIRPPHAHPAQEVELLKRHLTGVREHILGQLAHLDAHQGSRSELPSGWTPAQLAKHLTIGDEHYWFACVLGGDPFDALPHDDWALTPGETLDSLMVDYRASIDRANSVMAMLNLDDPPAQPDPRWDQWGASFPTARDVVLHVLVEIATHAGHLDAVCELINGRQWIVMD